MHDRLPDRTKEKGNIMTPRERVFSSLNFQYPDRLPRDIWGTNYIQAYRPKEWERVTTQFPLDFFRAPMVLGSSLRATGQKGDAGIRVDEWGSVWKSLQEGISGEVVRPILHDWSNWNSFHSPNEMLDRPNIEAVNLACRQSDRFRLGEIGPGPFERLQFLRGTEALLMDMADQDSRLGVLLDKVHEFFLRHVAIWCQTEVDGVTMGDDWGSQTALLISPHLWRKSFKPLYKQYFERIHQAGKKVFFHSDGMIWDILPDLLDLGADAINCQVYCIGVERISREYKGKVAFWGELDRQSLLSFGQEEDVRKAARDLAGRLDKRAGGFIGQLYWGTDVTVGHVQAAFEEWNKG
jgi:uroporphyrinogen decarboxylase